MKEAFCQGWQPDLSSENPHGRRHKPMPAGGPLIFMCILPTHNNNHVKVWFKPNFSKDYQEDSGDKTVLQTIARTPQANVGDVTNHIKPCTAQESVLMKMKIPILEDCRSISG